MLCSFSIETGIIYLIYKNKKKAQGDYIKKLNLANLYCVEYIPSIKIKLRMIIWHWRVYFLFYFIILYLNIYNNINFILETEKAIYFHFTDIIIIFCYCLIYRPRKWPSNFDVFFKNDFNYFDNIYYCKLNFDFYYNNNNRIYIEKNSKLLIDNYNGVDSDNEKMTINETLTLRNKKKTFNSNDNKLKKYYTKNKDYPIVILNPEFFFNKKKIEKENNKNEMLLNSINNSIIGIYTQ